MPVIRFDPFRGFERISRRMNEFINELEKGATFEMGGFNPRVDIMEDEKNVYVFAELPGVSKDNIKVSVNEDRLMTIKGEKKQEDTPENRFFIRNERNFGNFSRTFLLPENIDIENISAKFENGVLELALKKIEPPKPKEVNIEIN